MLHVRILPNGFEFDGEVYQSLSAVAKAITGSHTNGYTEDTVGLVYGGIIGGTQPVWSRNSDALSDLENSKIGNQNDDAKSADRDWRAATRARLK